MDGIVIGKNSLNQPVSLNLPTFLIMTGDKLSGKTFFMRTLVEAKTDGRIRLIEPEGTYLLWLDCRGLGLTQPELVRFMKEEAKLILNDGASFGSGGVGFMRMNVACPRATVEKAISQLLQAVSKL